MSECGDPEADWFPQRAVCYPTMQLEAIRRRYDQLHQDKPYHDGTFSWWTEEPSDATPFHYLDGVHLWVSREDLTPDDNFLDQQGGSGSLDESDHHEGGD